MNVNVNELEELKQQNTILKANWDDAQTKITLLLSIITDISDKIR